MTPKLSLVIPAYNNAEFISETIDSILAQDFQDWELIIADHSSSDGTLAAVERFAADPRISVVVTEAGGGAPRNWNRVTELATGEYLKLVCGDDLLRPGVLSAQVAALDANPDATLTASPRDIVDADGVVLIAARGLQGLADRMPGPQAARISVRAGTNVFGEPACVMVRRATLEQVGGWDSRFPYLIDQATYSRILLQGHFVAARRAGAAFRLNGGQWSVALAASQADQAREMHEWLRAEAPEILSASDVRVGNLRARLMSYGRRMVYAILARRMRRRGAR